jgi:uncharacterized protein YqjF (DUF2071 family)
MSTPTTPEAPRRDSPYRVRRPVMHNRWDTLTFLHWPYPVDVVQALLPAGLRVEQFDGRAWVGLVPFFMQVRPPGVRWFVPPGRFPETNVRTYVHGPDGSTGVYFFSLEAARRGRDRARWLRRAVLLGADAPRACRRRRPR